MELFPYQHEGAKFLSGMPHALLADEMGLGKSAQAVRAADLVGARDILVCCPGAVRVNWEREFHRFSPMDRPCNILLTGRDRPAPGVNIVSYDLLVNEKIRAALKARAWDVLVLDEAHFLKERSAKRTKAVYGHAQHPGITHSAKFVWRLTGTPAPNNASELYTHLKNAGIVKTAYWDFVFSFCDGFNGDFGYKITGAKNVAQLKALLAQFMLRRKKDDPKVNLQLPPITFVHTTVERSQVELDPWFFENWHGLDKDPATAQRLFLGQLKDVDQTLKAAMQVQQQGHHHTFTDTLKLLEAYSKTTAQLRRYLGLAKLPRVADILEEELESGAVDKLVIFAVHAQVVENMRVRLRKFGAVTLYGNTPMKKRQEHIDSFQKNPKTRVFIGNILAAGTGITLTAAHEVAFVEADWVPANNAQAAMRCHRVGQTRPVRVRFFNCAGSVDEQVNAVLVHKTREITKFMG